MDIGWTLIGIGLDMCWELFGNELGIECEPDKLVLAQKWMVQTANAASLPVFLQSQVLESMMTND